MLTKVAKPAAGRIASTTVSERARLVELLMRLAPQEGFTASALEGVTLMRANRPLDATPVLYEPCLCILVQGRKRAFACDDVHTYDAQHYLVAAVPLPFVSVTEASAAEPMLGLTVRIDPLATAQIALAIDARAPRAPRDAPKPLFASPMDAPFAASVLRLAEALASPLDAAILGPALLRELYFRALTGQQGDALRATLAQGGHFGRIARALHHIHRDYAAPLDVDTLAADASMSVPAFHAHFKRMTATTPIQYVKATRLHHARLLMVRSGMTAASAAATVGYESASQFSREFKRFFGRTPTDEAAAMKDALVLHARAAAV